MPTKPAEFRRRPMQPRLLPLIWSWPCFAGAWLPGPAEPDASSGFSVDRGRRNDVASFHQCVFAASEGYASRMGWTGNYAACNAGTNTRAFHDDIQRRVNYYRALAGVPTVVLVNDGRTVHMDPVYQPPAAMLRSTAAQEAALMVARGAVISHAPASGLPCFTAAAGNACYRGSIAYTFHGPGAIDEYLRETSSGGLSVWSAAAGHRRWLLYPPATSFASGDTPGGGGYANTNVFYCIQPPAELAAVPAAFCAWPPPGFFPDALNTRLWSLSHPGADFSTATVTMTDADSKPVAVAVIDRTTTGYGDPAIVWQVPAAAGATAVAADTVYQVSVSGIAGAGVPAGHSYTVTLFDPDTLNESQTLVGTAAPPAEGARYALDPVDMADGYRVEVAQLQAADWTEGAEDATRDKVTDGTSPGYLLRDALTHKVAPLNLSLWRSGGKAFRLAIDSVANPPPSDWFELDRELLASAGAQLSFYFCRGYMTSETLLRVETSADGGLTWQPAGNALPGNSNGGPDVKLQGSSYVASWSARAVPLPVAAVPLRVRFRLLWPGGSNGFYSLQGTPGVPVQGIFLDDITVSNSQWLEPRKVTELAGTQRWFTLDATSAGTPLTAGKRFLLRRRSLLGTHWFNYGPIKDISVTGTPLTAYAAWQAYRWPLLAGGFGGDDDGDGSGNGLEYAFAGDPLAAQADGSGQLRFEGGVLSWERPLEALAPGVAYGAETSQDLMTWSTDGVQISHRDGVLRAEVSGAAAPVFLRWKVLQL